MTARYPLHLIVLISLTLAACEDDAVSTISNEPPYAVGSRTVFIHDPSRGFDTAGGADAGLRILITEIWYPADRAAVSNGAFRRATYGDYVFGNRDVHRLMMTATTFFHLTPDTVRDGVSQADIDAAIDELYDRERNSYVKAPLARGDTRFPLIVMSHGDAGSRYNLETACEFLAAHGYVVIAPEHTGNSPYAMIGQDPALAADGGDPTIKALMADVTPLLSADGTWGSRDDFGQTYAPSAADGIGTKFLADLDRALLQRVNDLRAVLQELDAMNASGSFAGRLDLERIGLMGRSFGGSTTLAGLSLEPRFTAGVAVVPLTLPDLRANLPAELLRPEGQESVLLANSGPAALAAIEKPTLLLLGAEDRLIIGAGAAFAAVADSPQPRPDNPYPALRRAFETTRQPVVLGVLADSNHGSFGVSGPYWWPALKPDIAQRHFDPTASFTLVDPQVAHRLQREKILQFFDLFVRGDQLARRRLVENSFADHGLVLETRNLDAVRP